MRTSRPQMFMEIAQAVAKRATCMRLNVGAVIVQGRSIVSIGYNGAPSGASHCTGNDCPGKLSCRETIHAEDNAIRHLHPDCLDLSLGGGKLDIYVTDSPCLHCFEKICESHAFGRIFFGTPYRINDHLINHEGSIKVYRVLPSGYVVDWETQELVDVDT